MVDDPRLTSAIMTDSKSQTRFSSQEATERFLNPRNTLLMYSINGESPEVNLAVPKV